MKPPSRFDRAGICLRLAAAGFCALFIAGCESEPVALAPPLHTRVVDGVTKLPIDGVRVTLVSRDTPQIVTAYSDRDGIVALPPLLGDDKPILRHLTDTPALAVHAVFQHPGYETYSVDSVNGYGFFKGYYDVHLYPH
ncbi:MAG TPA: hypothetical protein VKR31_01770 [Rhizomicrobium sp.]|nr:hypothetical protein [Rhizomicrobium sp.]